MKKIFDVSNYEYISDQIHEDINGFKILQISDLHNRLFDNSIDPLILKIKELSPDVIAVTGDVIDARKTDVRVALSFFEEAVKICPVYYVLGNHEHKMKNFDSYMSQVKALGVVYLNDECVETDHYILWGLDSEHFEDGTFNADIKASKKFIIAITHKPHFIDEYSKYPIDLVLAGHAHGGQFRLPFIKKGLYAPGQGIFPKYAQGIHVKNNTALMISRGIGNSLFPFRLNNRPEIVTCTLKR